MNEHFDAVIVGSGFGGSVMTYRLAEAGLKVCLLERGKSYPPNSFPRSPHKMAKNFWDPSEGLYGLYNLWSFKGSGALVSSGLGGGSLIYANVLIRKDEKWFKEDLSGGGYRDWVVDYKKLEPHYERAERMMNIQEYPLRHPPYEGTAKTLAMIEAAKSLKDEGKDPRWMPLNLAVSFRSERVHNPTDDKSDNPPLIGAPIKEEYPNYHTVNMKRDMPRSTCRLCGECDLGCNYGSKNTLDFTYLSEAIHQKVPAEIRTLCEVKAIKPRNSADPGYQVTYEIHDPNLHGKEKKTKTITCNSLILSAGTFGTPFLFFKNREAFPNISNELGNRYSVNGDLLSFISNAMEKREAIPRTLDPSFGPVITSAIRYGDELDEGGNKGRGFYVEDGGHPNLMSWLSEISGISGYLFRSLKFLKIILRYRLGFNHDADLGAEISQLLGEANVSKSSMPILSMGRDFANARLSYEKGRLGCDWTIKKSQGYFERVRGAGKAIAKALDAEYRDNPSYKWNFQQVLTAHPLGGCAMARDESEGVVNSCGEVFNYPGLYIADGSVMPGSVGPNPSLTIAALADRFADHIIAKSKGEKHECDAE